MSFKKILFSFILSLLLICNFRLRAHADFASQKTEFTQKLEEYNSSYSDFQIAKNSYETYQTLSSLTQALDKSKIYLAKRDELIIKHFQLLVAKINETDFKDENSKVSLIQKATDEISFFESHVNLIPAIATINDVTTSAGNAEGEIPLSNIRSKQILGEILIEKVRLIILDYDANTKNLAQQISEIKSKSEKPKTITDKWERWLVEINNKRVLSENNLTEASNELSILKKDEDFGKKFDKIRINIVQGNLYLKEGTNFMEEILEEMKYQ